MTLFALLLDLLAAGSWYIQAQKLTHGIFVVGMIVQSVIALILLGFTLGYRGRRNSRTWAADGGYHPFTIRYSVIVMSFVVNAIMIFLYYLNLTGRNAVIFS